MKKRGLLGFLILLIAVLGLAAAGCGGDDDDGGGAAGNRAPVRVLRSDPLEGDGDPEALIASDLPLQGANRVAHH